MKEVVGYEVLYTGTFNDGTQEQLTMCASESAELCREWIKKDTEGWLRNGWEIIERTSNRTVLKEERQGIVTHEVLRTYILK